MSRQTLYLMLGYPGAGKTTVSKRIAAQTSATHLWADSERHKRFDKPNHSHEENLQLYDSMNQKAGELLADGKSVVFDTSFNLRKDRDNLRAIATETDATTLIVWVCTPKEVAKHRAVHAPEPRNGYDEGMTEGQFNTIADKLETPGDDEKFIKIDGTKLDEQALDRLLHQ